MVAVLKGLVNTFKKSGKKKKEKRFPVPCVPDLRCRHLLVFGRQRRPEKGLGLYQALVPALNLHTRDPYVGAGFTCKSSLEVKTHHTFATVYWDIS